MALPLWHTASALPLVTLALYRRGPLAALAAATGAVLIDADHLLDWVLNGGREDFSHRIVVPLHGWEYPGMLLFLAGAGRLPPRLRGGAVSLAAGLLAHLVLDTTVNRPRTPAGYSFLYRLCHGFRRIPSWLPVEAWRQTHAPTRRPAPRETACAAALASLVLLLAPTG